MTRTMCDAANGEAVFPPCQIVAGYTNGKYPSAARLFARYPQALHLPITVTAASFAAAVNGVLALDVEGGDASPAQVGRWVADARGGGIPWPWAYFSTSNHDAVVTSCRMAGVALPFLWGAQWDGVPIVMPGYVAKQYQSFDTYDPSAVIDYIPGLDGGPAPVQPTGDHDVVIWQTTDGHNWLVSAVDVLEIDGTMTYNLAASGTPHTAGVDPLYLIAKQRSVAKALGQPDPYPPAHAAAAPPPAPVTAG